MPPPTAQSIESELKALGYALPTSSCISLCCALCTSLQIPTASAFANQLHAFCLRGGMDHFELNEGLLKSFQASFTRSPLKSPKGTQIYSKECIPQLEDDILEFYCTKETQAKIKAQRETTAKSTSLFSARSDAGKVELVFPSDSNSSAIVESSKVEFSLSLCQLSAKKRFCNSVKGIFGSLNQRIESFEEKLVGQLRARLQDAQLAFGHPWQSCTEAFWTAGMVLAVEEPEGKSIYLQTSMRTGANCKVKLRLDALEAGYALFSGQVVAVLGKNLDESGFFVQQLERGLGSGVGSGVRSCVSAESGLNEVQSNASLGVNAIENASTLDIASTASSYNSTSIASPVNSNSSSIATVNIACGPFCLEGSLDWEPLDAFLQVCTEQAVKFVILCGPFIPESVSGALNGFPEVVLKEQLFEKRIFAFCQAFPNVQVFIVPSGQEVSPLISPSALPQPAMKVNKLHHSNLHLCTNPFALSLFNAESEPVTLRLLNADILLGLSREELTKAGKNSPSPMLDRMSRLAGYLVEQQNLFPLVCPGLDVEFTQIWGNEAFDCCCGGAEKREVLILPSSLRFFAKRVGGVTVVNPGQLCRSRAGGVYCQIQVGSAGEEDLRVKVIKI